MDWRLAMYRNIYLSGSIKTDNRSIQQIQLDALVNPFHPAPETGFL